MSLGWYEKSDWEERDRLREEEARVRLGKDRESFTATDYDTKRFASIFQWHKCHVLLPFYMTMVHFGEKHGYYLRFSAEQCVFLVRECFAVIDDQYPLYELFVSIVQFVDCEMDDLVAMFELYERLATGDERRGEYLVYVRQYAKEWYSYTEPHIDYSFLDYRVRQLAFDIDRLDARLRKDYSILL